MTIALQLQNATGDAGKAVGTLTFTTQPADGDIVVLGSSTYTFRTTVVVTGEVAVGADVTAARDNLVVAINADNVDATAAASGANLLATAILPGPDGNSIETTAASAHIAWGASTLTGGLDANAYITVAFFKSYHTARGHSYAGKNDDQIASAIINATDYVDTRYRYIGIKLYANQTTEWPRQAGADTSSVWWDMSFASPIVTFDNTTDPVALRDSNNQEVVGIPTAVERATAEYAFRALTIPLFQDAPAPSGGRQIKMKHVRVSVIQQTIEYEPGQAGAFALPVFPAADLILTRAGLVKSGRQLYR